MKIIILFCLLINATSLFADGATITMDRFKAIFNEEGWTDQFEWQWEKINEAYNLIKKEYNEKPRDLIPHLESYMEIVKTTPPLYKGKDKDGNKIDIVDEKVIQASKRLIGICLSYGPIYKEVHQVCTDENNYLTIDDFSFQYQTWNSRYEAYTSAYYFLMDDLRGQAPKASLPSKEIINTKRRGEATLPQKHVRPPEFKPDEGDDTGGR